MVPPAQFRWYKCSCTLPQLQQLRGKNVFTPHAKQAKLSGYHMMSFLKISQDTYGNFQKEEPLPWLSWLCCAETYLCVTVSVKAVNSQDDQH
eukprot:2833958-Amphidinium_carterae.1